MIPIQELLHRIRWDPGFGGRFEIGYYDRLEDAVIRVPLAELRFPGEAPALFELLDQEGVLHSIPFHRIKAVWRDGSLIWHREH
jgi:uncharacterized protein (UPF0248 family)